jgi:hypothetical protein
MKTKIKPNEIFLEYEEGKVFNQSKDLYTNVEKNQRFYLGDQWYGVNAPDLTKPVFNILKRVCTYYTAMLASDEVGINIAPMDETTENKVATDIIAKECERVLEQTRTKFKWRTNIKNAIVDGDTCMYMNFNPDVETGHEYRGAIETEIIDNTNVIFGNPYSHDICTQPYILIVQNLYTNQVKEYAESKGVDSRDIKPDNENLVTLADAEGSDSDKLTTVITKFWFDTKKVQTIDKYGLPVENEVRSVWFTKVTKEVVLDKPTDLGYKNYPIAYFSWEKVKNCYHGRSPITGLIPNQIFINKIYAMCMVYMTNMGFPRIFYDENKISKLTNSVASATKITNMDLAGKMMDAVKAPDFSNQIIQLVDSTIAYTKDFMGASDAALGNISNPNNTSAIVAVQQASSVPLEIQKLDYYQFVEDIVRSMLDIMANRYGQRIVKLTEAQAKDLNLVRIDPMTGMPVLDQMGMPTYQTSLPIDFSMLKNLTYDLTVDVGQASYWSEQTQVQTADALFDRQVITDPVMYLEMIPDKYIKNKGKIVEAIKLQQEQMQIMQQQMMAQQAMMGGAPLPEESSGGSTPGMADGIDNRGAGDQPTQQVYAASKEYYQ